MAVNFIDGGNWSTGTKLRPDRQEPNSIFSNHIYSLMVRVLASWHNKSWVRGLIMSNQRL